MSQKMSSDMDLPGGEGVSCAAVALLLGRHWLVFSKVHAVYDVFSYNHTPGEYLQCDGEVSWSANATYVIGDRYAKLRGIRSTWDQLRVLIALPASAQGRFPTYNDTYYGIYTHSNHERTCFVRCGDLQRDVVSISLPASLHNCGPG